MARVTTVPFTISLSDGWLGDAYGAPEVAHTAALIRITLGEQIASRVEDDRSLSVHDTISVSAYPLALWIASSWWRLRWEPLPKGTISTSWKMAHQMPAAGYGYIWPPLTFQSDGETIEISGSPSLPAKAEPVRYLSAIHAFVDAEAFERTIDDFLSLVLNRLDTVTLPDTDLHRLWGEVLEERNDPETALWRQLEALLGFEPDEAPEQSVEALVKLVPEAGRDTVFEVASACAGPDPAGSIGKALGLRRGTGLAGRLADLKVPRAAERLADIAHHRAEPPYERGRRLASLARQALGYGQGPVSDDQLSALLGLTGKRFETAPATTVPFGVAIREDNDRARLFFRRRNRPGRRFEAARFIADHLVTPPEEHWLPSTDAKTVRQKLQRAFAAEFLCPIGELTEFLGDDFSNEAIEDAGEEFGISPLAVRSHLVNNDILPVEALAA